MEQVYIKFCFFYKKYYFAAYLKNTPSASNMMNILCGKQSGVYPCSTVSTFSVLSTGMK